MSRRQRARLTWVLAMTAAAGCGDTVGPNSVVFTVEPAAGIAGEQLSPAIEVTVRNAFGDPLQGTVTITLDPNPCAWRLSGTLVTELAAGVARFPDLVLDKLGHGYTLRASYSAESALSRPFDIASPVDNQPLIHHDLLCTKPNDQNDAESLTWIPEDDAFWIADDERVSIYQVDRKTGKVLSRIRRSDFVAALPSSGQCDDGDGDPNTTCSYVNEFEQVTYDPAARVLYVVNTVNSVADRPAIFRLSKQSCAGCFTIQDWQPLPPEPTYSALGVVAGNLLVGHQHRLYAYDYATNRVATVDANGDSLPPQYAAPSEIVGLSFDGSSMWILTVRRLLYRVQWSTKTLLAQYDLGPFSISTPKGLETIRDTIYVLEGDVPNPLNVFTIR